MRIRCASAPGSVLTTALVIMGLVSLMLGTYMTLVSRQNHLAARSLVWAAAVPLAEAGLEEAFAHLNTHPSQLGLDGWTKSGRRFVKRRTLGDGYYYSTISTTIPPTLVSIGFGRIPMQSGYIHRKIMVTTKPSAAGQGILAKSTVTLNGQVEVDSFNSAKPRYSTSGRYDAAKRRDRGHVVSLSSAAPALTLDNTLVYGSLATGPNGTADIGPDAVAGNTAWVADPNNRGTVQAGYIRDDFGAFVPPVTAPFTGGYFTPGAGTVDGTNYTYVIGHGRYRLTSCRITGGGAVIVTGKAQLHVLEEMTVEGSAYLYIEPGATLELFLGGNRADLGGNGVITGSGLTKDLTVYGLPTLTNLTITGSSDFVGTVYAPQAELRVQGPPNFSGAMAAQSVTVQGPARIHCDEALAVSTNSYLMASWEEL